MLELGGGGCVGCDSYAAFNGYPHAILLDEPSCGGVVHLLSLAVDEKASRCSQARLSLAILAVDQCHRNP